MRLITYDEKKVTQNIIKEISDRYALFKEIYQCVTIKHKIGPQIYIVMCLETGS